MGGLTHADCPCRNGSRYDVDHELYGRLRLVLRELSGLTRAIGDGAPPCGHAGGGLFPSAADDIDDVFASAARGARLELLEVRPGLPARGAATPSAAHHRMIVGSPAVGGPGAAERIADMTARGIEIRTTGVLPVRIAVVDREVLAVALELGDDCGFVLVERSAEAARQVAARFTDSWWTRARPCGAVPAAPGSAASVTEAAVIEGLVQGLTDESVARRVGITPRTVRRYVAAVSERYGATSRLQLGVLIGRAGGCAGPDTAGAPGRGPQGPRAATAALAPPQG